MHNYFMKMMEIYNHLCDKESRALFDARISYLLDRYIVIGDLNASRNKFVDTIDKLYAKDEWHSYELENKIRQVRPEGIIIFGCGYDGKRTYRLLTQWGHDVAYFCDNSVRGKIDEVEILSLEEVVKKYKDYLVIIGSSKYGMEMYIELVQKSFPPEHILLPEYKLLNAVRGWQYFDVFKPQEEEVFIDVGTYDGSTIIDFSRWTEGKYKKIYGFEPIKNMHKNAKELINRNQLERVCILNYAAWDKKEELQFVENAMSSCQSEQGEITVQGIDIDSIIGEERVTFIKMDIEGSEYKALEGARNTIIKNRPRMAICIYHKPTDVIDIPLYLLSIVPEYKFYIRHYEANFWGEEVLYATI